MRNCILIVSITTLVFLPMAVAKADEKSQCKVKVGVINMDQGTPQKGWKLWPPSAEEWWTKDGKRKFRDFCWAMTMEEADWLIVWSSNKTQYTQPAVIIGLSSGTLGGRGAYEAVNVSVRARLYRGTRQQMEAFNEQSLPEPSLISSKESRSSNKPPGRMAFEELFKYAAKQPLN